MTTIDILPKASTGGEARRSRPFWRRKALVLGALGVLVVGAVVAAASGGKTAPNPVAPATAPALLAHGVVEPVAQATVATMSGGVVRSLAVRVGQEVSSHQQIAQVSTVEHTEILLAPWRGTILGLNVRLGDTVMPGAMVATLGDLSRYQVRTTDVDEYLIGQIQRNQQVSMTVEALDGRKLEGTVDTVALVQQSSGSGVVNYPIVITLGANDRDLRPGMTVRVVFSPRGGLP